MPKHVRGQIADRIEEILLDLPTTADRVFKGRTRALKAQHQPSLLVYVRREQSDIISAGNPAKLQRIATAVVEGRANATGASAAEDVEATLDQIAAEVEPAMAGSPPLGGLAIEVTLTATEIEVIAPGDVHEGRIWMQYRVTYLTLETQPTVAA